MNTPYKRFFIIIEGDDDERFFRHIIIPTLERKYDSVTLWKYAQEPNRRIERVLHSIKAMGADYIYVADINDNPCVTAKKQKVENKLTNIDKDRIVVVVREIESWYPAGLSSASFREFGLRPLVTTDTLTKEQFNALVPKKFGRIDFMIEILKYFSVSTAKRRNKSFAHFLNKHIGQV